MPFPGFPTDFQAPAMTLASVSSGTSIFIETIFESRYKHVPELKKMGANIVPSKDSIVICGVNLNGAKVMATDLRGGAGLVVAGLNAKGTTVVSGVEYIDRGYEKIEKIFEKLGGKIARKMV